MRYALNPNKIDEARVVAKLTDSEHAARADALKLLFLKPDLLGKYFHLVVDDPHPKVRALLVQGALVAPTQIPPALLERLLTTEIASHVHRRRYLAVGLLHFIKTVDIGLFLVRCANDSQWETRRSVLETMCARLNELSPDHVDRILRAQLQSDDWRHRHLALTYLADEQRLPTGRYLALCAGEKHPQVHQTLLKLASRWAPMLSEAETDAIFRPEILADDWKQRMSAVMVLRTLQHQAATRLLELIANDSIAAIRHAAQQALALKRGPRIAPGPGAGPPGPGATVLRTFVARNSLRHE